MTLEREYTVQGFRLATHPEVYVPSDDTLLLARHASSPPGATVVEVGCGTGLVSLVAARDGAHVVATDKNPHAVRLTRHNARRHGLPVQAVCTDLWAGLRAERIDRLLINPPYLPTRPEERVAGPLNLAFDAGPAGRGFVDGLAQALGRERSRWREGFRGLIVASSLQDASWVEARLGSAGFTVRRADDLALPHERLVLLQFRPLEP